MGLKYKILVPLLGAFLAAILVTGVISVNAARGAVEASYRREMLTARGFLTRMRPPLSPESLRKMKSLFQTDLAVTEGRDRMHSSTFASPRATAFERALQEGAIDPFPDSKGVPGSEKDAFFPIDLEGAGYRVICGRLEGPASPGGEPYVIFIFLEESRITAAKGRAVLPVAAAAGLGILVVLAAGGLVARSLTRRVRRRSRAASKIAAGEDAGRVEVEGGDELARFAEAFNRMVDALAESRDRLVHSERMAALGKLASAVAHEIRNPLASIRMTAEILRPELRGEEPREALDLLLNEIKRLEMFLEELLTLSGGIAIRPEEGDPSGLVAETLALLRRRFTHLRIQASNEVPPGAVHPMDGDRVKQVLMNLLINGADAAGPGGKIRIRGGKAKDGVLRLEVWDSGPGVEREVEPRLFEPFFTTRKGGTGLGLAVSRRIAEAHGGRIAYRREGEWTVFTLEVP